MSSGSRKQHNVPAASASLNVFVKINFGFNLSGSFSFNYNARTIAEVIDQPNVEVFRVI